MQIKFSSYKIIIILDFVGFIISITAFIISYYMKYYDNLIIYFSSMKEILHRYKKYKFLFKIFCMYPLYSFSNFMELTFELLTIYYFNNFFI